MIKFLHCADVHLDSPLSCLNHAVGERLRDSLKQTFLDMLTFAKEENLSMVLIAGDLFDTGYIRESTVKDVKAAMGALSCPVIISPGNHDPYHKTGAYTALAELENVYLFTSREMQRFDFDDIGISVSGYAFTEDRLDTCPLSEDYELSEQNINVLCAHADMLSPVSKYAPLRPAHLSESGFSYAALGHVHKAPPAETFGRTLAAYCGFAQGRSYDEPGYGGAMIVSITEDGRATAEKRLFSRTQYLTIKMDISGAEDGADVLKAMQKAIESGGYGEETSLRVVLGGVVSPDCEIRKDRLVAAFPSLAQLEVRDDTIPVYNLSYLENDLTIKGEFYRALKDKLFSNDDYERKVAAKALKIGLCALDGRPCDKEEL